MPLGESMISSLKSNNSIKLDKSSRFKKTLGGYGKNKKPTYDFPKATPEVLAEIQSKTKKEQKLIQRTTILVFISVISIFLFIIFLIKS
jgi:hypothetical protein